ncbi:probable assembly chaperone of rpl4 [Ixodes scapularis]|uniref:probable assembly chaperone of rpl4 n=1 Tax=Ixodes scapularis TaxID=6945 RepID=UPI001A9EFC7E|nr:probable assembly chaperone of rpl4 [Ixodes scapularis]
MGRSKAKQSHKTKRASKKNETKENKHAESSVEELLSMVESAMDELQFDQARQLGERALRLEPDNLKTLDVLSGLLLEMGDVAGASQLLQRMIELEPDDGFRKYLSMGQLCDGKESLRHYSKGVEILQRLLGERQGASAEADPEGSGHLSRELSSAYCAMAEIYMTDCCFEGDAETQCAELIERGLAADPKNPEALQCQASYLLVKQDTEGAQQAMRRSLDLWLPQHERLCQGNQGEEDGQDPVEVCPLSYSCRVSCAKVLIELEMMDEANAVLDGLVEEDDEVVDVWYLLGWLNYLRAGEYMDNARFYLTKAKQVARKVHFEDSEELAHIEELLAEIGTASEDDVEGEGEGEGDSFASDSEEEEEAMEV